MSKDTPFLGYQIILLLLSFIILKLYFPIHGSVDFNLIQPWIDQHGNFYLKNHWALTELAHRYVKYVLIGVYAYYFIQFIRSFLSEGKRVYRAQSFYFFVMVVLSTSMIGMIKSQSDYACPWDMLSVSSGQHYAWNLDQTSGHCFPGGHASTGFALIVGFFLYREYDRPKAYFYLIASVILGMAMGWAQMMRGAHFFSHNLWSGWLIWCLNFIVYVLLKYVLNSKVFQFHPFPTYPRQD